MRQAGNRDNEGFFWYAGHCVQIDGENFLLPVDVDGTDDISVKYLSFPVNRLIESFEKTARNKVNVVVLDVCRNNPFTNSTGKSRNLSRGLSVLHDLPPDLFVIYSTAAGDEAADGAAGKCNSPGNHRKYPKVMGTNLSNFKGNNLPVENGAGIGTKVMRAVQPIHVTRSGGLTA